MRIRRRVFAACLVAVSVWLSGCASNPPPMSAEEARAGEDGYLLGPGDKLRITVYNEPGLTGEYIVTPTGTISFPLVGEIQAKSRSIVQVQREIEGKLSRGYIKDARANIEVLNYRPYYIFGEVNKPGQYDYSVGLDVQQAIAAAGGFTYRANQNIVFVRRAKGEERSVDLREGSANVLPGDTIRIGERYF